MSALPLEAVLCLGSNVESRKTNISKGLEMLRDAFEGDMTCSTIYETPSHSGHGAPYLNQVIYGQLQISYDELVALTKEIERSLGRTPESKVAGKVPLDIDVVLLNGEVLRPFDYNARHFQLGYSQIVEGRCSNGGLDIML